MADNRSRLLAVLESIALFVLAVLLFTGLRRLQALNQWERGLGVGRFVEYTGLLVLVPAVLALTRRRFEMYGFNFSPISYHLGIFAAAFIPVFLLSAALTWIPWQNWPGALLISVITVGMLILTAWMLRGKQEGGRRLMIPGLLVPLVLAPLTGLQAGKILASLAMAYLLVGPAEEALFRGAIQSRLNLAFGRPFCTLGIQWGWGLLGSAILFGLWHVALNPGAWPQALWTFFAGLIFGIVREKSGSLASPALLHGVLNYGPQALLFDLFFR